MLVICVFYAFQGWCLLLKDVHSVGGSVLLCTRVILNFVMVENEIVLESVGRVNETIPLDKNIILSHSLSNVENVHQ